MMASLLHNNEAEVVPESKLHTNLGMLFPQVHVERDVMYAPKKGLPMFMIQLRRLTGSSEESYTKFQARHMRFPVASENPPNSHNHVVHCPKPHERRQEQTERKMCTLR